MRQHLECTARAAAARAEAAMTSQQAETAAVRARAAKQQAEASAAIEEIKATLEGKASEQLSQQKMATEEAEAEAVRLRSELESARKSAEAAAARVADSEVRHKEMHRCLVDLASGMHKHKEQVKTLQEVHKQREAAQAEIISRLQREREYMQLGYAAQATSRTEPPPARVTPKAVELAPAIPMHATTCVRPAAFTNGHEPGGTEHFNTVNAEAVDAEAVVTGPVPILTRQPLSARSDNQPPSPKPKARSYSRAQGRPRGRSYYL